MAEAHENGQQLQDSVPIPSHTNGQAEDQNNKNPQLKAFQMHRSEMESGIKSEISDLSSRCWSAELISDTIHNQQFDGEPSESEMIRAEKFYTIIYETLKGYEAANKTGEATKLIQGIADIVGSENAFKHMAETISK